MATEEEKVPDGTVVGIAETIDPNQGNIVQATTNIDDKINLLTQKAQIYLELLQDDTLVGGDKFDGDIDKILKANEFTEQIPLKLYTELKNCLAQLGDLYNMKENVLIDTLGEYLVAAKDLIEKLGDETNFEQEQKKLEDGKCTASETEEECKAKMDAAIARINELKGKMLSIIEEKKGAASQYDGRKKSIKDLQTYFEGIVFDVNKIDELITAAENMENTITEQGEKEMVTQLITELKRLKEKGDQSSKEAEEEKKLEAEAADLQQQLEQAAAKKVASETAVLTAEQELEQSKEEGGDTTPTEEGVKEEKVVETPPEEGGDTTPTEEGVNEEKVVVESETDSDQGSSDEIAQITDGNPITSDDSSKEDEGHTSGETVSTEGIETGRDAPANIMPERGEDETGIIPTGEGVKIVQEAKKEQEQGGIDASQKSVEEKIQTIEQNIEDGGQKVPQVGGRKKQSKKRRRKGKRKTKKRR